jgi:sortase A
VFSYYVSEIEYLEEKDQPLDVRHQNATWLENTPDQRVTLVSCWPRSGTHRLLVIATR